MDEDAELEAAFDSHFSTLYPDLPGKSLTHYGVKGMKWGVHKAPDRSGYSRDAAKAARYQQRAKKHGVESLSNQELRDYMQRKDLEMRYNAMNRTSMDKGRKFATDLVLSQGRSLVISAVQKQVKRRMG